MIDERDVATILCPDLDRPLDEVLAHFDGPPEPRRACPPSDPQPSAPPRRATTDLPEQIGGHAIKRLIGRGGQGAVYEAVTADGTRVAIKLFHPLRSGKPNVGRFRREADTLGRLKHPGITALRGSGFTPEGQPYLVMDYIDGHGLRQHVQGLPCDQRLVLFLDICKAVQAAHDQGVVHRDIKPSNILIGTDGVPKVCDFGLARFIDRDPNHQQLSEGGRLIGTPRYMSPEQIRGERMDTRSDVYSLGLILYQLITDSLPYTFENSSLYHAAHVVCDHQPRRPSTLNSALDRRLDSIVLKALDKDRAKRYPSVKALIRALERVMRRRPRTAKPTTTRPRRGRWAGVRLLCAGITLGMAFGAVHGVVGLQQDALVAARHEGGRINRARLQSRHYSTQVDRVLGAVVEQLPDSDHVALTHAAAIHTALALNCQALGLDVRAGEHMDAAARLTTQAAERMLHPLEPPPVCPAPLLPEPRPSVPPRCILK